MVLIPPVLCCFDKLKCLLWKGFTACCVIPFWKGFCSISVWKKWKNGKNKTHKWGQVSLYSPPTVRWSRIKLVSCKMLKQRDDWTSFEREATEERRCKNTSTAGTLVTFNMTHQTPASYKDILITEVIMSVPISPLCGNLSFLAQLPQSNEKKQALWWQDRDTE